ncbi:hypothetical protein FRZ61_37320 [Hypericibacter adhaerens]|jgi:hypothetical protein|uniref:Uncharacterized protein n=1 Tax=Hypericibacter adhaerens TaxID=2602016 RepID=A0A5J6N4S8_9PROT|nr:hypothetical protein [Hypericibacter adhaerens]QEX23793.1 hypothetical protein FRZ61_37320 [Hypericibacter adhaerens]
MSDSMYAPTEGHFLAFGQIIQGFARHEHIMQALMGKLVGAEISIAYLLTTGLGYAGKRDTLLSLLRHVSLPAEQIERIRWYLGELHKHNKLRNHIAHSMWVAAGRPGAIKPHAAVVRGGVGQFVGFDPDEPAYTSDELIAIGNEIAKNYNDLLDYLAGAKLVELILT